MLTIRSGRKYLAVLLIGIGVFGVLSIGTALVYNQFAHYESRLNGWPKPSEFIDAANWHPDNPHRIRILAIDGGAMHGILYLEILKELEKTSGRPVAELFDLFAGASTGAIISVGLLVPGESGQPRFSTDAILERYEQLGQKILSAPLYHRLLTVNGLLGPRLYNHTKFVVENKIFAQTLLGDLLRPIVIPVFSRSKQGLVEFRNWNEVEANIFVAPLLAAATAVPSYFPAVQLSGHEDYDGLYADALFILNNPSHRAFLHALERFPDAELVIVSLGKSAGTEISVRDSVSGGLVNWLRPIISMVLHGQSDVADSTLQRLEQIRASFKVKSFRLAPEIQFSSDPMDASAAHVDLLKNAARDFIAKNRAELDSVLDHLQNDISAASND